MRLHDTGERGHDTGFTGWRTSSFSNPPDNQCVEVAFSGNAIATRDSKNRTAAILVFGQTCWDSFLNQIAADRFNPLPHAGGTTMES